MDQERVVWFLLVSKGAYLIWTSNSFSLHYFFFANTCQVFAVFPIFQFQWTIKIFQSITRSWWFLNFFTGQTKLPGYLLGNSWLGHRDMVQLHYFIIYSIHFLLLFSLFFKKRVEFFKNLICLKYRTFSKFLSYI